MDEKFFFGADILLPKQGIDLTAYSVVACDQYTAEPDYWQRVKRMADGHPSTYYMVYPEAELGHGNFEERISAINETMRAYLDDGMFDEIKDAMIYVERIQRNGMVRRGIIGLIDLEAYDYRKGGQSLIRATEGTVLERIPPRVKVREHAPLELPHVMLLVDDEQKKLIEPLHGSVKREKPLYDFDLMDNSGHLTGWFISNDARQGIQHSLEKMMDQDTFNQRYGTDRVSPMLFAVGDGNHSLASAKACYENLKESLGEAAQRHPARYALVELVNLHDESLEFEAIHRVVFGVDPARLLSALKERYPTDGSGDNQELVAVIGKRDCRIQLGNTSSNLTVGSLQTFLDGYLEENGGEVDYIHGENVVRRLCSETSDRIGFILPAMEKSELFPTVILDGALPRKTFSMGDAWDKRFYLEARRIK